MSTSFYANEVEALEAQVKSLDEENDLLRIAKLINWKAKEDAESRLREAQDVLKDICHHVGKDCFATCKGDWSGTSCYTYRIWDAMNSPSVLKPSIKNEVKE